MFTLVEVMYEFDDMAYRAKYQIWIERTMLRNICVSMTWCETKPGGGYKKVIWAIAYGRNVNLVVMTLGVSEISS